MDQFYFLPSLCPWFPLLPSFPKKVTFFFFYLSIVQIFPPSSVQIKCRLLRNRGVNIVSQLSLKDRKKEASEQRRRGRCTRRHTKSMLINVLYHRDAAPLDLLPLDKNTSQSPLLQEGVKSLWCFTQSSITYSALNQE